MVELISHLAQRGITRMEATAEAERDWGDKVQGIASMTLFPRADSWSMGANIPGKPREMLHWPGGLQQYLAECRSVAEGGYRGFALDVEGV